MYEETKVLVAQAFKIGKLLFALPAEKYNALYNAIKDMPAPKAEVLEGQTIEEAVAEYIQEYCAEAAISVGLDKQYGEAMLEYAILMKEVSDQ